MKYCYTDPRGAPLKKCSVCGHDLTSEEGVSLDLLIADVSANAFSRLDEDGVLQDTADRAIQRGYHESTRCGCCYTPLARDNSETPIDDPPQSVTSRFVCILEVTDPDTGMKCELEVRKLATGELVGLDGAYLAAIEDGDQPNNPYDDGVIIVPDDAEPVPDRNTR